MVHWLFDLLSNSIFCLIALSVSVSSKAVSPSQRRQRKGFPRVYYTLQRLDCTYVERVSCHLSKLRSRTYFIVPARKIPAHQFHWPKLKQKVSTGNVTHTQHLVPCMRCKFPNLRQTDIRVPHI